MSAKQQNWSPRSFMFLGFVTVFVLVFGLGAWSVMSNIAGAVITTGMIEVDGNRKPVQHPDGGVVGEILVDDGDTVQQGDILLKFDDRLMRSELAIVESQLFEIMARKGRLEAERDGATLVSFEDELRILSRDDETIAELMDGQQRLFLARKASREQQAQQLRERLIQINKQIDGTEAQVAAQSEQEELIIQELNDQQSLLDRGLTQQSRVLQLRRERARLSGILGELNAEIARSRAQITEIEIEILRLDTNLVEAAITELRDLEYREIELKERRLSMTETLNRMEVKAPVSGVVYGRQVNTLGAVVRPADVVMYLVPQDEPLVISSRIEAIHIDQVEVGQEATLRFSAFDQRTTPEIFGVVTQLSADVFTDENTGLSYYTAELLPKDGEIEKLGDRAVLPGMPVDAFIKTGDRTPLNYLVKPLADYFNKAFRED